MRAGTIEGEGGKAREFPRRSAPHEAWRERRKEAPKEEKWKEGNYGPDDVEMKGKWKKTCSSEFPLTIPLKLFPKGEKKAVKGVYLNSENLSLIFTENGNLFIKLLNFINLRSTKF